jgi:hypothetical protein
MVAPARTGLGGRAEDVSASQSAPLPAPDDPAFAEAFDSLADARVAVLAGPRRDGVPQTYPFGE